MIIVPIMGTLIQRTNGVKSGQKIANKFVLNVMMVTF